MERHELLEMMVGLKLTGMRAAFDEALADGLKRQHPVQRIIGDRLGAAGARPAAGGAAAGSRAYRLKESFDAIYDRCLSASVAIDAYDAWQRSFPHPDNGPDSAASRLARDLAALFAGPMAAVEAWQVEVFIWFDAPAGAHGARPR